MLQKVRKQGIRFWHEQILEILVIYKSLIPTFGSFQVTRFAKSRD